eukprot:g4288.t1
MALAACSESSDAPDTSAGEMQPSVADTTQSTLTTAISEQPNVVFILVDDMGFGDVGYNGAEFATPNLDEMASAGVTLDRNYVYPICSPTRAALLTGHNPLEYGIDGPMGDHTSLPTELKIMPEYFKELGYQTIMVGKWHLGIGNTDHWPISRGFDYHYGFLGGWVDFYTHMYSGGLDWQRNGESLREEGHVTDLLTADAIQQIEARDRQAPLFMYLNYNAPHSPLQHPPEYSGLNNYPEMNDRSVYAEMMTHLDAGIGQVIGALESEGILHNTIVVFSSDNGGATGLGADNGDLRRGKGSMYEGGTRVPGLIMWPDQLEAGQVLEQPIVVHDWLPTLMDAVGAGADLVIQPYGQSMWAAIGAGEQVERRDVTFGVANSQAAFQWPYKAVRQLNGEGTGDFLFNVVEDPAEQNNLSEEMPELFAELVARIEALPEVESRGNPPDAKRPEGFFRNEEGGWNYDGQGGPALDAPPLAAMEAWYVENQLRAFKNGWRGMHPEDVSGLQMSIVSGMARNEATIDNVAAYIQAMDPNPEPEMINGQIASSDRAFLWVSEYADLAHSEPANVQNGRAIYATGCVACHGAAAEGNQALAAPKLTALPDWYIHRQLQYFRNGIRGSHAEDIWGATMVPFALMLSGNQAIADVTAYIETL